MFTADTVATNVSKWPDVTCRACHNFDLIHNTGTPTKLSLFNSKTKDYNNNLRENALCGQCHGNLRFPKTDHLVYNAWKKNKHNHTQRDVARELAGSHAGETPQQVIESEDCIACHGPTAVMGKKLEGMSESEALGHFFTTKNGKFTSGTRLKGALQWPGVGCAACHDPHNPKPPAYFNSATKKYEPVADTTELCGRCHGNLRFPDTDHLSYNIELGTGGVGVPDQQTMPGVMCTDCHMYTNGQDGSKSTKYGGHTFKVMMTEADGTQSAACTKCHLDMDAAESSTMITDLKNEFQTLDSQAQDLVGKAAKALEGVNNPDLTAKLDEAQKNLTYAESDESGGFHNHNYLIALLNDAVARAQEILSQTGL